MKVSSRPSRVAVLVWTLAVHLVLCGSGVYASDNIKNCGLKEEAERKILSRLEPLTKKNFTAETRSAAENYTYVLQICGDAGGIPGAGLIQMDHKDEKKKPVLVGRYNETQVIGGTDWVMLIYRNGDRYDRCSKENRKAIVMISCARKEDTLVMVMEDRERSADCSYIFELDSSALCPPLPSSQLSAGSIILIIGLCVLAVYLIGGFLYQRLVVGAKGMEQFPNYAFWAEFGNLTADGCDFVCRSRNREEAPTYRGVATEPLEDEPEERDDHLLPM
ncbi:cation-dependent mannose-6-phosphate receptor [Diretmus argenteus]